MLEKKFNPANKETYDLLMRRRSVKAKDMQAPGPDKSTVEQILAAGMRVPDHGKLAPWRFIVLEGNDRSRLGDLIAQGLLTEKQTDAKVAEKMKGYATQGPVLVVAIHSPAEKSSIPLWEQELSIGAACQNMLVAATALGYASQWLTGWASFSPTVTKGLGLKEQERIAGFLFFGSFPDRDPSERPRPVFSDHVQWGIDP